jgi:hypothetical protein
MEIAVNDRTRQFPYFGLGAHLAVINEMNLPRSPHSIDAHPPQNLRFACFLVVVRNTLCILQTGMNGRRLL